MALHCKTPQDVAEAIRDHNILFVDVKFTDLYGQWHHFSMPIEEVDIEALFVEGHGFDGSSIRGFKTWSSDMNLIGDPTGHDRSGLRHADIELDRCGGSISGEVHATPQCGAQIWPICVDRHR